MQERQRDLRAEVSEMLEKGVAPPEIEAFLDGLEPAVLLHTMFALDSDNQRALLAALTPHRTASRSRVGPAPDDGDGHVRFFLLLGLATLALPALI